MLCFRRKNFWGPSHGNKNGSLDGTLASTPTSSQPPGQAKNGLKSGSSKLSTMAPPPNVAPALHPVMREVTEDTPPDLLEGTMDLLVTLPSKKNVRMTVSRRTPMMDLLIQVATANKIVPGGHIVQVRNERGIELPYKPSTPIGALDTTTIEIVPKNQVNEYIIVKKQTAKIANQPFEQTFRLQVHLPRNQLYVVRVSAKALLEDILQEVCREKNLDPNKYEMRHPVKLDEKLPLDRRLGDFGLTELTVVSRNSRINSSVSTADILALQQEEGRAKGCLDSAFKHSRSSVGESSVSSESAVSARGISPSRSDDSRSISPLPPARPKLKLNPTMSNASSSSGTSSSVPKSLPSALLSKTVLTSSTNNISSVIQAPPRPKKRAAPQPPGLASHQSLPPTSSSSSSTSTLKTCSINIHPPTPLSSVSNNNQNVISPPIRPTPRKKEPPREPPGLTTKATSLPIHHSRHSSDSSGYHEASDSHDNRHRFDRQQSVPSIQTLSTLPNQPRVSSSVSVSNLTTVSSISSTSLASSNGGIRKRKAPKPPAIPSLQAQKEIEEEISASTPSLHTITSSEIPSSKAPLREKEVPARHHRKPLLSHSSQPETSVEEIEVEDETSVKEITVTLPNNKEPPKQPLGQSSTELLEKSQKELLEKSQKELLEKSSNKLLGKPSEELLGKSSKELLGKSSKELLGKSSKELLERSSNELLGKKELLGDSSKELLEKKELLGQSPNELLGKKELLDEHPNEHLEQSRANQRQPLAQPLAQPVAQPSLEESSLPTSLGTSFSTSSSTHSSLGSTSSSPVPTPEGSSSTPTTAAPSSQQSFEEPLPESPAVVATTTMSQSAPSPVVVPAVVVEEGPRPSSTNAQASLSSSSSAAPSVPARKPRTVAAPSVRTDSNLNNGPDPTPQPKPKPRPRSSTVQPASDSSSSNNTSSMTDTAAPPPPNLDTSTSDTPVKPVVTRMGVKVLPDNALEARLARMSRQESERQSASAMHDNSSSMHENTSSMHDNSTTMHDNASSMHQNSSTMQENSSSMHDNASPMQTNSSSTTKTLPRQDSKTVVTRKKGRAPDPLLLANKKTVASAQNIEISNNIPEQAPMPRRERSLSQDSEASGESDNLEENLELFEPSPTQRLIKLSEPISLNLTEAPTRKKRIAPVPQNLLKNSNNPNDNISSISSNISSVDYFDGTLTSPEYEEPRSDNFTRTASDRHLQRKTNLYVKHRNSKESIREGSTQASKSLNRWQNYESLDAIEGAGQGQSAFNSLTRQNPLSNPLLGNANTKASGGKKKISVSSHELTPSDSDDDKEDVIETNDDSALVSSESEASCADSGIPQTETVTPSPVDRDLDRSEKDLSSSQASSRRSSMHSIGGTENNNNNNDNNTTTSAEALREILQAKIQSEQEIIDKAFEGIDTDVLDIEDEEEEEEEDLEGENRQRKKSNSNFDLIKPPALSHLLESNASSPHPATDHTSDDERDAYSLSSHDEEEHMKELKFSVDPKETDAGREEAQGKRRLPKSESFSHNSEFDVVKMKRRIFSKEGKMSAVGKKSFDFSSSDEEMSGTNNNNKGMVAKGKAGGSMQNLSNLGFSTSTGYSMGSSNAQAKRESQVEGKSNVNARRNGPANNTQPNNREVRKATSVLNIQDLDPDISQNPQLMASFQNELEAQFEQWKVQFLQRHLGGKKASFDNSNNASASETVEQVESTPISQTGVEVSESVQPELNKNSRDSLTHSVVETQAEVHSVRTDLGGEEEEITQQVQQVLQEIPAEACVSVEEERAEVVEETRETVETQQVRESFDPEKPQIIHSVSGTVSQQQPIVTEVESNNRESSAERTLNASVLHTDTSELSEVVKAEDSTDMPVVNDKSAKKAEEEPKIYRYSGPPTIQMGTWGDRPSRSVSVKKDTDYIMGMGQQNPQTEKPTVGSVAARISSYVTSQPPTPLNTSTLTRSSTSTGNTTPRPKSIAVMNSSSSTDNLAAPISKVLSSWQQKVEQNKQSEQNEKKTQQNGSEPPSNTTTTIIETVDAKTTVLTSSENSSTSSTLERPRKLPAMSMFENNNNSNTLPPSLKYGERRSFGYNNSNNNKSVDEIDSASDYSSSSSRPNSSLSRAPSNASTSNITIGSMSDSTSSSPIPPTVSLSEKKKFFQGIKPVESSKEAPIPAQNLKGNIATIQRVFEARQKFNAGVQKDPSSNNSNLIITNSNSNSNISSTAMVQKVIKAGSFNVESFRRTPSPAPNPVIKIEAQQKPQPTPQQQKPQQVPQPTIILQQQQKPQPTPQQTIIVQQQKPQQGPQQNIILQQKPQPTPQQQQKQEPIKITNTNRISVTAFEKPVEIKEETIKNLGNKSIIIVGSEDKTDAPSNNIYRQKLKITAPAPPAPVMSNQQQERPISFRLNDSKSIEISSKPSDRPVLKRAPSTPVIITANAQHSVDIPVSAGKVSSIAASLKSNNNGFFNSLQRPAKESSSPSSVVVSTSNKGSNDKPVIIKEVEKPRKVSVEKSPETVNGGISNGGASFAKRNSNGTPIPPPPPINLMEGVKLRPASASNGINGRPKSLNTAQSLPAGKGLGSPNGDPRSDIFEAIKNSNGNFKLKKTGSTILLN